jgi:hypothetical protein
MAYIVVMFDFAMHVMWVKMTNLTLLLEFAQKEPDMDMATTQDETITYEFILCFPSATNVTNQHKMLISATWW